MIFGKRYRDWAAKDWGTHPLSSCLEQPYKHNCLEKTRSVRSVLCHVISKASLDHLCVVLLSQTKGGWGGALTVLLKENKYGDQNLNILQQPLPTIQEQFDDEHHINAMRQKSKPSGSRKVKILGPLPEDYHDCENLWSIFKWLLKKQKHT